MKVVPMQSPKKDGVFQDYAEPGYIRLVAVHQGELIAESKFRIGLAEPAHETERLERMLSQVRRAQFVLVRGDGA